MAAPGCGHTVATMPNVHVPASSTVVVGIDGFAPSEDAVTFAARLAGPTGCLLLASAVPYPPLPAHGADPTLLTDLQASTQATLDSLRSMVIERVAAVETLAAVDPSPARMLQELAAERGGPLIVVGSSHLGRLGRVVPGSTAERLLHGAPCPVVVVPKHASAPTGPLARIGVAVDGSRESDSALRSAAEVAHAHDTELRVIAVCDAHRFGAPAAQNGPGFFIDHDTRARRAQERLDAAVAEVEGDVRVTPVLREGAPAAELVAESESLDVLFLGSRGYGPLRAVLLGGVSGAVVRDAACPVVVTPRGDTRVEAATHAVAATA